LPAPAPEIVQKNNFSFYFLRGDENRVYVPSQEQDEFVTNNMPACWQTNKPYALARLEIEAMVEAINKNTPA